MLVINFSSENYDTHMTQWRDWKMGKIEITSGSKSPAASMIEAADRVSDTIRAVSAVPTATARHKKGERLGSVPQWHDNSEAIELAMKYLRREYPDIHRVVESQYMHSGPSKAKSAFIGITYDDYRRKMSEGKKMIAAYLAGISRKVEIVSGVMQ